MFKQLKNYYLIISFPFVLLLCGSALFFEAIKGTITRNPHPQINYTIFVIILFGGIFIIVNARRLVHEARTLVGFSKAIHANTDQETLKNMANGYTGDLACLLQMVASSGDRSISHQEQAALEHELTNTRSRLNRRNGLPQYLTGLLVGMGLLGTFIGLLATLNDIALLISSFGTLDMQTVSPILVFQTMIERMKAPMQSMGIAFSASMFGLLGSIILGLMMVGTRRLQGDLFSLLSSELARHIEIALSHRSLALDDAEILDPEGNGEISEVARVLLRIEERYAETARSQQRALSAVIDDLQKQRLDMLQALTEQTEASSNFRGELQQLGRQFGNVLNILEKGTGDTSEQISGLTVQLAGNAKETNKLLTMQIEEQKQLRDALDSYNIEEWLAETARAQHRTLSSVTTDMQQQRTEMLRTLTEQTEASNNSRSELQRMGSQLGIICNAIEKGNGEISTQISELTIHSASEAKEAQVLLNNASSDIRSELQQIGNQLGTGFGVMEKGHDEISAKAADLLTRLASVSSELQQRLEAGDKSVCGELQQLASQLVAGFAVMEKGHGGISAGVSDLLTRLGTESQELQQQQEAGDNRVCNELQQLASQLVAGFEVMEKGHNEISAKAADTLSRLATDSEELLQQLKAEGSNVRHNLEQLGNNLGTSASTMEKGHGEISTRISELMAHISNGSRETNELLKGSSIDVRGELKQLGSQLGNIFNITDKGNGEICTQISELIEHMADKANAPQELLTAEPAEEQVDR